MATLPSLSCTSAFVTLRYLFHNPTCDILRSRIKWQNVIDMLMVKHAMDFFLDMLEVADHAIGIECTRLAIDGHNPVMSVDILTFTG